MCVMGHSLCLSAVERHNEISQRCWAAGIQRLPGLGHQVLMKPTLLMKGEAETSKSPAGLLG